MSHLVGDSSHPLASQTPGKPQPLAMPMRSAPHPAARLVSTRHLVGKVDKIRVGSGERPKKEETASHDPSSVQKGRERGGGRWLKGPQTLLVLTRSPDLRVLGAGGEWTATGKKQQEVFGWGGSVGNPQTLPGSTPSQVSTPSAKRSLLKLQGFPSFSQAGGSPFQTAAHPGKERNPSLNNGLETYRVRRKKSELSLVPHLGLRAPPFSSLLPPCRGPRLSRPSSLPPSLSPLALSLLLPSNPGTLSLSPSPSLPLSLLLPLVSLGPVLTVCTSFLLSLLTLLVSLSLLLSIYTDPFIPTLTTPS